MVVIVVMGVVAADAFSTGGTWFAGAAATYRGLLVVQYWRARRIPVAKALATFWLRSWAVSTALWLTAVFIDGEARYALCAAALLVELATPFFGARHTRARRRVGLLRARRVARGALPWTTGTSPQPPSGPFLHRHGGPFLLRH